MPFSKFLFDNFERYVQAIHFYEYEYDLWFIDSIFWMKILFLYWNQFETL